MKGVAMTETISNIGWSVIFSVIGGLVGMVMILLASVVVTRLMGRLTPNIDEEKEIARGNRAVAEYYSRIVAACILGVSMVVAAAVLGGILSALH
jgi:uncharacterized membrane protein YjfL (UPF0719 family)